MPKRSWPSGRGAATQRSAQRDVRSTALSRSARGAPAGGHSSNAMAMSEPSYACTAIASSGVKRATEPS